MNIMRNRIERRFRYTKCASLEDKDIAVNIAYMAGKGVLDRKYIVIFGVNAFAEHIIMNLNKHGFDAGAIIDNNSGRTGEHCGNTVVAKPEDVLETYREDAVILIASRHFDSMSKQLISMGYSRRTQIFQLIDLKMIPIKPPCFVSVVPYALKCRMVYERYRKQWGADTWLFLIPIKGLGDMYFIFGYLQTYIEKHKIENWKVLAVNKNAVPIGKLFGISDITIIPVGELHILNDFGYLVGYQRAKILCTHWADKKGELITNIHKNMPQYAIPFNITYEYAVFGEKLKFTPPSYLPDRKRIETAFSTLGLQKGKTVILAPDSNSLVCMKRTAWDAIIEKLKTAGFCVCTNLTNDKEQPLPGTVGFHFSIEDSIAASEIAGYFIGMRSGLCDVISNADCKKIFLYTHSVRLKNVEEVFSFGKMGIGKKICEICVESIKEQDLADIIFQEITGR